MTKTGISTDSDDDSDDIFSEVFNREPYEDSGDSDDDDDDNESNILNRKNNNYSIDSDDDDYDNYDDESGRPGGEGDGALTSVEGSNDINREGEPGTEHKYTTADMKTTPCWQRCLQLFLMFLCFLIIMIIISWFMNKIFWSEELKPDDYDENNPYGTASPGGAATEDDGLSILPKGRTFMENRCSATNIGGSLRPFCETACEPYNECCTNMFGSQNGTCYAKEFPGCYSYAKCSALSSKAVLDPAPVNLDRLCATIAISVNPGDCQAACESSRCCWDDAFGTSCKAFQFETCQDYSQCQNLRTITTTLDIVPIADTDLDLHCKKELPLCKRECLDARCCNNKYSDCYRDNFIACLSYSSCNYMEDSGVIIDVPEIFSVMRPAASDIGTVCKASTVASNPVPCQVSCEPAKCCFTSGTDNCFGDDPLGCLEYSDCIKIFKDISQIVNPQPTEQPTTEPLIHNRQFIINSCGEVELENQEDRNTCYDLCEPSFECCDPFKSDTSYDCFANEIGECYSYSRCHAVTADGGNPSPDNLGQVCDMETLKTGQTLKQCTDECAIVACCWDYMDGSVLPCLDQKFTICQDYLPCQNLKAYEALVQAGQVQPPTSLPTSSPTKVPTASPTKVPTASPTKVPTASPTKVPTALPTTTPPTLMPTVKVTAMNITAPLNPSVVTNGTSGVGGTRSRRQTELSETATVTNSNVNDSNVADSNGSSSTVQGNAAGAAGVGSTGRNDPSSTDQLVIAVAHPDFDQVCKENVDICTTTCMTVKPCCDDPTSKCYKDNFMACLSYAVCPTHTTKQRIGEVYSVLPKQSSNARQFIETECLAQTIKEKDSIEECQLHCNVAKCCSEDDDLDKYCFNVDPLGCLQYHACGILYNLPNIAAIAHLQPSASLDPTNTATTVIKKPVQDITTVATPPMILGGPNVTTGLGGPAVETSAPVDTTPIVATPIVATPVDATSVNATQVDANPVNATSVNATQLDANPVVPTAVDPTAVDMTAVDPTAVETTTEDSATAVVSAPTNSSADQSSFLNHRQHMQDLCTTELVGDAGTELGAVDSAPCFSACDSVKFQDCCDPFDQSNTCYSQAGCYSYARCHTEVRDYAPPPIDLSRACDPNALMINPLDCMTSCLNLRCCWDSSVGSCWSKHFSVCSDYSACQNLRNVLPPQVRSALQETTILNGAQFLPVAVPTLDLECQKSSSVCQTECEKAESCCSDSNSACYRDNFMSCLSYSACVQNPSLSKPAVHIALPVHYSSDITFVNEEDISSACTGLSANEDDCRTICEPSACCFTNPATESCFGTDPFGCSQYALCQTQNTAATVTV